MSKKKTTVKSSSSSSGMDTEQLKTKLLNPGHWLRGLLMVLMFVILHFMVKFVLLALMVVQWVLVLLSGEPNARLMDFTKSLNRYGYQIMEFVTFHSDERPFPLSDWPASK